MPANLANQVALVTGASSGIGRSVARALAERGAIVCLAGRDANRLSALRDELRAVSPAHAYVCDLVQDTDVRSLRESLGRDHERLDLLVHSAGTINLGRIESMPVSELDMQYRVNLRAPFLLTQALLPLLKAAHGQVVFVNSSVGTRVKEEVGAYAATKHALKAIADTLRMENNQFGIRVLSVYPGNTATPMQQAIQKQTGQLIAPENLLAPEDVAAVITNALLLPRTAEVTDINIRPFGKTR